MSRNSNHQPTESELEILQILWDHGASTVKFVNGKLNEHRDVGYTTTLKIMQIMHSKNLLTRERSGRSHIYSAVIQAHKTRGQLVDRLLDTAFGGSAKKLMLQILDSESISAEDIAEIQALIKQKEDKS